MGGAVFRSARSKCERGVEHVRETFARTSKAKPRAKSLIGLLKLALRQKYVVHLHRCGAVGLCLDLLEYEPFMRELALLILLGLTLEPKLRHDMVVQHSDRLLRVVTLIMRQERSSTNNKYSAVAIIHSLSRHPDNLEAVFNQAGCVDGLVETIAYETEGSLLRALACEILLALSEVSDYQNGVYRAFSDIASRLIIGEVTEKSRIVDIAFATLRNLTTNESNSEAILNDRILMEWSVKILTISFMDSELASSCKTSVFEMLINISCGSESAAKRVANLPRLPEACIECIPRSDTPISDPCGLAAIRLLHILTTYPGVEMASFTTPGLSDALSVQGKHNVYARMAFINLTGAFNNEDEREPGCIDLVGCEDIDDKIVDLLEDFVEKVPQRPKSVEIQSKASDGFSVVSDDNDTDLKDDTVPAFLKQSNMEKAEKSTLLSIAVLLRRPHHLKRLGQRVSVLVLDALDCAITENDTRTATFALACLKILSTDADVLPRNVALPLLGRIQGKVHPAWLTARLEAERLVCGIQSNEHRFKPVVDMLERVLDDKLKGYTHSLDVPLASLTFALDTASVEEKQTAGRNVIRLLPRVLRKAMLEDDADSAKSAVDLMGKVMSVAAPKEDAAFEQEKAMVAAAVREIMSSPSWRFDKYY